MVTVCPEDLLPWCAQDSMAQEIMPHIPHISVKAERFTKPTSLYRSERKKKKKKPGGFRLTETVQGCFLFLIISLRECGKWDDVFYNAPKCLFFFFIFFFCSFSLCFITSVFHRYANTLKLTKQPMSFLEDRGRLGVAVERAFSFWCESVGETGERRAFSTAVLGFASCGAS